MDDSYDYAADDVLVVSEPHQLRALADDLRARIVLLIRERAASITELSSALGTPKGTVGHHVKVLEKAGLVARGRERQWRPARLRAGPLKEVAEWTERYRRFWEESYERLDEYLDELQGRGKEKGDGRKR